MPYFTSGARRLFYREQGSGPLLLILPGNTASSACHAGELAYWGTHYHTAAPDFHGTGRSDRLACWPTSWWRDNASDAAALVAHLGHEQALVMGASGGAVTALWMAVLHPDRVRAVIADSCVETYPAGWLGRLVAERAQRTAGQTAFWQQAHGEDWAQVVEADSDLLLRFQAQGADLFAGHLKTIRCPVLFTGSLQDDLLPPDAGEQICRMARQVDKSQVFLNHTGGHPLMWSRPDIFRPAADLFLQAAP